MYRYDISEGFRHARMICGYTQEELGHLLGISKETVSNYETGKTMPDIITIMNLASLSKCSIKEIVKLKQQPRCLVESPINQRLIDEFRGIDTTSKSYEPDYSPLYEIIDILRKNKELADKVFK